MNTSKLSTLLCVLALVFAVIWLAVSVYFFVLHFAGTGMIPLYMPIVMLLFSGLFFFAFFRVRKLRKEIGKR